MHSIIIYGYLMTIDLSPSYGKNQFIILTVTAFSERFFPFIRKWKTLFNNLASKYKECKFHAFMNKNEFMNVLDNIQFGFKNNIKHLHKNKFL